MRRREWITISAAGLTVGLAAAADDRVRLRTRVKCVPGIPARDYQYRDFSATAFAVSAAAVALAPFPAVARLRAFESRVVAAKGEPFVVSGLEAASEAFPAVPTPGVRANMFQFIDPTSLRIDHCMISEMAAVIDEEGQWVVSLRADQNPILVRRREGLIDQVVVDDVRESVLQTNQFLRNLFHVRVFGYAAPASRAATPAVGVTDPAVFEATIPPFWVQRGRPRRMRWTGSMDAVQAARAYGLVDRIGVEFSYQMQPGLRADRP
ncbi:hypothetical protein [Planctomyces sp. SH-PL62]|uniref:hypothetical protein n=1 Tax=Planctomyces sp. SH-PL62 TaxID=1636152 RepID=UPI00078DE726|nr:hypothetical protein [Planctomyces sp. SH-PL62]AMV37295.1 hypothetical protein VT85_07670 [Planctomyces sp. SH-PL62]